MLCSLELRDFAIASAVDLSFGRGLCVLTGETGAGKSIVVDALAALLGGRAGADLVRAGSEAARLRAVFDLSDAPATASLLDELGFDADPDGLLHLTRQIRPDGRSRATVNGSPANVAVLRQLGECLVDIHGQHEHQALMRPAGHLAVLDSLGGPALETALAGWRKVWTSWCEAGANLERLRQAEADTERRRERLSYLADEIDAAQVRSGEQAALAVERGLLANTEQRLAAALRCTVALEPNDESAGALAALLEAAAAADELAGLDPQVAETAEALRSAAAEASEAWRDLQRYAAHVEADPQRLAQVEERLDQLRVLTRKYDTDEAGLLDRAQTARVELDELTHSAERSARLEALLAELQPQLHAAGQALSAARQSAALTMAGAVERHLADLHLPGVRFVADLHSSGELADAAASGWDQLEFLFSANPAEPPRALSRIASGGEISRLMLAIKSVLAERDAVPTMVFDEIDVGIGGVTLGAVAEKMARLAEHRQILVVTHHAVIAARATCHLAVEKAAGAIETRLTVSELSGESRLLEIARMLGRKPPTQATLSMARELLGHG